MSASDLFLRLGVWPLALCLAAMPGVAQETGAELATTPDENASPKTDGNSYSLLGTVINAISGEPVRRAAVQISGQNGNIALTDAGGHFVLEGLAEGDVFLTAIKPGFYDGEASHTTAARVGKDAPSVVLKLTPWGAISGRVTTKDEHPLEGFHIRILAKQNMGGRLVWVDQPNQAGTNEDGEFRVAGLQAGTYYVAVDQSTGTTLSQKGVPNAREQIFARVYYPGVSEQSSATPIELVPGSEAELNFTLSPEAIYRVAGTLTDVARSVGNLVFQRKAGENSDFNQTVAVAEGKFEASIPAGAYNVTAERGDGQELSTPGATVVVRADEPELAIPLRSAVTIPIEIVREQGAGGSERKVTLQGGFRGISLQLVPVSETGRGADFWRGQAGGFPNVAPGTYRLEITTGGEWWVKSAKIGGIDLLSDDLTVVEGDQPAPIEVTVRNDAGIVTGTVSPAEDPARVLVLMVQPQGARNLVRVARGVSFGISGLAPGEYAILALDKGDLLEYANPEVLNPYLSDAEHISVRPHATVTINLALTSLKR